jgi:hypothetical protein
MPERAGSAVLMDFVCVRAGRGSIEEHDLRTPASSDVSGEGHARAVAVGIGPGENNEGGGMKQRQVIDDACTEAAARAS